MKQKFYDIVNMLRTFATYMLLLGERSNGKSWQAKYVSVWEAYNQCDYLTYKEKSLREPKARYQLASNLLSNVLNMQTDILLSALLNSFPYR